MYDVIIAGAGVVGCAIARELSRYRLKICVLEKETDICEGTSKANSGIVHAGFDAAPGTLKAKLNVRGTKMIQTLAKTLDFAYVNNEAMVLCFDPDQLGDLHGLYQRGIENGVPGLSILSGDEARALEPSLSEEVVGALLAETSGVVCPFEMTIAFAENAYANGAEFRLETEVQGIEREENGFAVKTSKGQFHTRMIINAAGVYADRLHNMVCEKKMTIIPRRGEYYLLDKAVGKIVERTIFQLPTKMGKGVLISPTAHGNILVGPSAENIGDKEDTATTAYGLGFVRDKASLSVRNLPLSRAITNFSGLRAVGETDDFILEYGAPGFIDAAAIESPGLTSSPAIAEYVADLVAQTLPLEKKEHFIETRKGVVHFNELTQQEQNRLIAENPAYGTIVCRCETVTEGEILDAIERPLGATTLDGVKRRTRAGMGRCQAGFCSPRVMALLSRKLGIPLSDVRKN